MMMFIGIVVLLVPVVILVVASAVKVPTLTFGVVNRLGDRSFRRWFSKKDPLEGEGKSARGRKFREGLHFVVPFIDKVKGYSADVDRAEFDPTVYTVDPDDTPAAGDKQKSRVSTAVLMKGSVMYRPSFERLKEFTNQSREVICKGILDEVKSELLVIAGQHEADDLIGRKEAVDLLINCKLRLEDPPHIKWGAFMNDLKAMYDTDEARHRGHEIRTDAKVTKAANKLYDDLKKYREDEKDLFEGDGNSIKPEHRIAFYVKWSAALQWYLEHNSEQEMGELERTYGIEITKVAVASIDFDPATRAAFQKKQQEKAKMRAAGERHKSIMERAEDIHKKAGGTMSWKDAHDQANVTSGISPQTIVTGQGFGSGAVPIINIPAAVAAVQGAQGDIKDKNKGKGRGNK